MLGILDYGMGNVRSVQKAVEFVGKKAIISSDLTELNKCDKLILPGVGSFGEGMQELKKRGFIDYIKQRAEDTPVLGICLGMQFLLEKSYEDGENEGFGFCKGEVVKFTKGKVPQIGWNEIYDLKSPLFKDVPERTSFYFVHSYHAATTKQFSIATTEYFEEYASAIWNGKNVYGTQFHPEKSGDAGIQVIKNFTNL